MKDASYAFCKKNEPVKAFGEVRLLTLHWLN